MMESKQQWLTDAEIEARMDGDPGIRKVRTIDGGLIGIVQSKVTAAWIVRFGPYDTGRYFAHNLAWADDTQPEPVEDDLSGAVKTSWDRFEAAMEASEIEQQTIDDLQDALKKSRAEVARWKEKAERSARRHLQALKNRAEQPADDTAAELRNQRATELADLMRRYVQVRDMTDVACEGLARPDRQKPEALLRLVGRQLLCSLSTESIDALLGERN